MSKLRPSPRLPKLGTTVGHIGLIFFQLNAKWQPPNSYVSFELKTTFLVTFDRLYNSKCNSLSTSWKYFLKFSLKYGNFWCFFSGAQNYEELNNVKSYFQAYQFFIFQGGGPRMFTDLVVCFLYRVCKQ